MKIYIIRNSKLLKYLSSSDDKQSYLENKSFRYYNLDLLSEKLAKKVIISAPEKVSLYIALWHPEQSGLLAANGVLTPSYLKALLMYLEELKLHTDYYKQYDGSDLTSLMLVLYNLIWAINHTPQKKYNEYSIITK